MLMREGEAISQADLERCLGFLVGEKQFSKAIKGNFVTAEDFASEVLGFEECEDEEEETPAADANATNDLSPLKKLGEAIPEEDH